MLEKPYDSLVTCIGTGFSGVCVGAQLKRWYNVDDIVFFDRQDSAGGTWWINSYPGIACDVPAPLYSFSFEQRASWSSLFPPGREIKEYIDGCAAKYDLRRRMRFSSDVVSCTWDATTSTWDLIIRDLYTQDTYHHRTKVLFAACGQLLRPNDLDIPGSETFSGSIFHSARWRSDVDCAGKRVVIIGNGCTAAQIVPNLLKVASPSTLTQIVRSKHWVLPAPELTYTATLRAVLTYIPGMLMLLRLLVFVSAELSFPLFYTNGLAAWYRKRATRKAQKYMQSQCPERLHEIVIPTFDLGCKRRIFDSGYLRSLHDPRMQLETRKPSRIVPRGIQLDDGTILEADVIVLANGFRTNYFLDCMLVKGENGVTVQEHWSRFGGAEAYNCSVLSGFPNFFVILGPNAATGHTSAIMAMENSVNYALRVLAPIFRRKCTTVQLKPEAEVAYSRRMQSALLERVWNAGCASWYIQDNKWNAMSYPWTQAHYWFRSVFPTWKDWVLR